MQAWLDIGHLQPNISITVPVMNKELTSHLHEIAYGKTNDHVTDDVT